MKTIEILSFGCKTNTAECIEAQNLFSELGFNCRLSSSSSLSNNSDFVIINTCTVTDSAEKSICKLIKHLKSNNQKQKICVGGCGVRAFRDGNSIFKNSGADFTSEKITDFLTILGPFAEKPHVLTDVNETQDRFNFRTRAFFKIQDGCDRFCSYCIIPYARGIGLSFSAALSEIYDFSSTQSTHKKEVVLTGINMNLYKHGIENAVIEAIRGGFKRVRVGSLEPPSSAEKDRWINSLKILSTVPEFCPSFHFSLQSGAKNTLLNMHRGYTPSEYYEVICMIRDIFPEGSISTDIIAGFDGESEKDFEESLAFTEKCGFSKIHVFPYSKRKGSRAETLNLPKVPDCVKTQRAKKMRLLSEKLSKNFMLSQIEKNAEILVENNGISSYTKNYARVSLNQQLKSNEIYTVKITDYDENMHSLTAKLL